MQNLRAKRVLGHALERFSLRININRRSASAAFERHGQREMSAFQLRGEHFADDDFQIEERRLISIRAAKLFDDLPAHAREFARICAIN